MGLVTGIRHIDVAGAIQGHARRSLKLPGGGALAPINGESSGGGDLLDAVIIRHKDIA